jgi:hypothetical protein
MAAVMRASTPLAVVIVGLLVAAAAGAAPRGAPSELRVARPADHVAHPAALSEWWTVRALDPGGRGMLEVRILREGGLASVRVVGKDAAGQFDTGFGLGTIVAGNRRLVGIAGPKSGVVVEAAKRGLVVSIAGPTVAGQLRLRKTRRGPAAFGWRLGTAARDRGPAAVTLAWTAPVATSSLGGALLLGGVRGLELRRWRGSYEHGWGDLLFRDEEWQAWDQYVVHGRGAGEVWLMHGVNRTDTVTGPGARDAQWLGVLARVDRAGVRVCRPRVQRRRWLTTAEFETYPGRLRAACGGLRFAARDGPGIFLDYVDHFEAHAVTTGRRGARGVAVHLGH